MLVLNEPVFFLDMQELLTLSDYLYPLTPQVIRTSMSTTRGSIIILTLAARVRPTWWSWTQITSSTSSGSVPAESRGPCPRTTSCLLPGHHAAGTTVYLRMESWRPLCTAAAGTSQRSSCCQRTASTPRIPCCLRRWGVTSSGRRRWHGRCLTPTCWCPSRPWWTATRWPRCTLSPVPLTTPTTRWRSTTKRRRLRGRRLPPDEHTRWTTYSTFLATTTHTALPVRTR